MQLGELVGVGNTADVFEYGKAKVIKLFKEGYPADAVEKEYRNANAVADCPFDKPKVYDKVKLDGRDGIIYERLYGNTILDLIFQSDDPKTLGEILAAEHRKILSNRIDCQTP